MGDSVNTILATDCGSTTTKAILIRRGDDGYRLVARGEAPTTVEAPFDDVTVGVLNAAGELEDLTGESFVHNGRLRVGGNGSGGADLYVSTSSAGGGLQMLVTGVVKNMTAESAQRAALGAGAIVIDVLAVDDGREDHEQIERIRSLRPDMILMSGGTEGGTVSHLLDMAEILRAAAPKPRLGSGFQLPVIYAGNAEAREPVAELLGTAVRLTVVDNLRPALERENLGPARAAIHQLFLEHVMAQAPGYDKLLGWTTAPVMATPAAVGDMVQIAAQAQARSVLAVDIGGATTDVFSVFGGEFTRTVSANLGMSYSVSNVLAKAGIEGIARWVPFAVEEGDLRNRLRNKMIRPTTIPQTPDDLLIEQAVAREALRLALAQHRQLAVGLRGVQRRRTVGDTFSQDAGAESRVNLMELGLIIGSGGVLSHAPRREQAALMMIDAFQPEGVTELAVDSIFMMPQLGVLAQVLPEAAHEVFRRDCLIPLGTVVAVVGASKPGASAVVVSTPDGDVEALFGELRVFPLETGAEAEVTVRPARGLDVGAGAGRPLTVRARGGVVGLIIDARGRPLELPSQDRALTLRRWLRQVGADPQAPRAADAPGAGAGGEG
ncbi:MAG TPA: glutamate mutase L [Armatimonadota bacterium]|nr:glutamate mutase L [Armatimonadota bacterium]